MDDITRGEIDVLIGRINDENARQNKRLDKLENVVEKINTLAEATTKLAASVESMQKEVEKHGARLEKIEEQPAEQWRAVIKTVITVLVTAAITYLLSGGILK